MVFGRNWLPLREVCLILHLKRIQASAVLGGEERVANVGGEDCDEEESVEPSHLILVDVWKHAVGAQEHEEEGEKYAKRDVAAQIGPCDAERENQGRGAED